MFSKNWLSVLKGWIDMSMVSGRKQAIDSVLVKVNTSINSIAEKIMPHGDDFTNALTLRNDNPKKQMFTRRK